MLLSNQEKKEIKAKWTIASEEHKTVIENVALLQQSDKAAKERIAELRAMIKKADSKKYVKIKELESQLHEMTQLIEQHGRN